MWRDASPESKSEDVGNDTIRMRCFLRVSGDVGGERCFCLSTRKGYGRCCFGGKATSAVTPTTDEFPEPQLLPLSRRATSGRPDDCLDSREGRLRTLPRDGEDGRSGGALDVGGNSGRLRGVILTDSIDKGGEGVRELRHASVGIENSDGRSKSESRGSGVLQAHIKLRN